MKIRNGFVSNSSSSSFIVAFDREPESPDDIKEMLFKGKDKIVLCGQEYDSDKISEIVFRDSTFCVSDQDILDAISNNGFYFGDDEISEFVPKLLSIRESYNEDMRKLFDIMAGSEDDSYLNEYESFYNENKGKCIRGFSYSDEGGGICSALEHGGIFDNISHRKYNHH